jgi:hypothetical protein
MGEHAEVAVLVQLESASKRSIVFEEFAWSRSILMGEYAEVVVLVQLESASECHIGFEELAWPRAVPVGKYDETAILLGPSSRAVEFRKLPIR